MIETFLHISEVFNRNSILKNGLFPSKVILPNHLESFRANKWLNENEDKMLYMWESCEKNEKFIKDMVYCKVWITPRNKLEIERGYNYINEKTNIYKFNQMIFDIYKVKSIKRLDNSQYVHRQEPSDDFYNTLYNMDERFAHNDKPLAFSKNIEKNIKIIGKALFYINKNNKICVKILKNY